MIGTSRGIFFCIAYLPQNSDTQMIVSDGNPVIIPGVDPGFSFGGAQKVVCQHSHYVRGTELTFGRGPEIGPN